MTLFDDVLVPWGKYKGQRLVDMDKSFIMYYAGRYEYAIFDSKPDLMAFADVCFEYAYSKGYIQEKDEEDRAIREIDKASEYIGEVGQKIIVDGVIRYQFHKTSEDYYINIIDTESGKITYFGKKLGEKGDKIKLSGRVKRHSKHNSYKSTQISYPKILYKEGVENA